MGDLDGIELVGGSTVSEVAYATLWPWTAAQLAVLVACWGVAHFTLTPKADKWYAADALSATVVFPPIVCLGLREAAALSGNVAARWEAGTALSHALGLALCGRMVAQVPVFALKRGGLLSNGRAVYLVHHLIVLVVYCGGCVSGRMHFFGSAMLGVEASSCLLGVIEWSQCITRDTKDRIRPFLVANSVAFSLTFFVCRLVLVPYLLWRFVTDVRLAPELTWEPSTTIDRVFPVGMVLILLLSLIWFPPAVRGTLKMLRPPRRDAPAGVSEPASKAE